MIYVGIDIAKLNHFASAIDSDGQVLLEPFEFLNDNDVEKFDAICMEALDFFEKQKKESEFEAFAGQADFIPDVPLWQADKELKEVAEIIVSTGMNNLESYQNAQEVLGH